MCVSQVSLAGGVEVWLDNLKKSVSKTIYTLLLNIVHDINNGMACDEWAHKVCKPHSSLVKRYSNIIVYPPCVCAQGIPWFNNRFASASAAFELADFWYFCNILKGSY